jgi:hypothetical protein
MDLDEEDQELYHYRASTSDAAGPSNATGQHLEVGADTLATDSWRTKGVQEDDSDYTRLRLDEDEESEEVHMRTKYLFNEDKAMTPLSQMQATKELLTEGQRIAYVGLCQLVARGMVRDAGRGWEGWKAKGLKNKLKGKGKEEVPVVESANIWMIKIMARLYQHMEVLREGKSSFARGELMVEQMMIESLAEHGVMAEDLVPALMTTHTVKNPEYDPKAAKEAEEEEIGKGEDHDRREEQDAPPPYEPRTVLPDLPTTSTSEKIGETTPRRSTTPLPNPKPRPKPINPFGEDSDEEEAPITSKPTTASLRATSPISSRSPQPRKMSTNPFGSDDEEDGLPSFASSSRQSVTSPKPPVGRTPSFDLEDDEGDIGRPASPEPRPDLISPTTRADSTANMEEEATKQEEKDADPERTPTKEHFRLPDDGEISQAPIDDSKEDTEEEPPSLPSLPGVSTSLTTADENVVLDIRWTVVSTQMLKYSKLMIAMRPIPRPNCRLGLRFSITSFSRIGCQSSRIRMGGCCTFRESCDGRFGDPRGCREN